MNIANGAQLVRVVRRAVIDDRKVELRLLRAVIVGPLLELVRKFSVRHNVNPINAADGREIIEHVINHRLACDRQERLWPGESERIQAGSVTGGENNYLHLSSLVWSVGVSPASFFGDVGGKKVRPGLAKTEPARNRSSLHLSSNRLGAIWRANSWQRHIISEADSQFKAKSANSFAPSIFNRRIINLTAGTSGGA